jgi:hypothetical protein
MQRVRLQVQYRTVQLGEQHDEGDLDHVTVVEQPSFLTRLLTTSGPPFAVPFGAALPPSIYDKHRIDGRVT